MQVGAGICFLSPEMGSICCIIIGYHYRLIFDWGLGTSVQHGRVGGQTSRVRRETAHNVARRVAKNCLHCYALRRLFIIDTLKCDTDGVSSVNHVCVDFVLCVVVCVVCVVFVVIVLEVLLNRHLFPGDVDVTSLWFGHDVLLHLDDSFEPSG